MRPLIIFIILMLTHQLQAERFYVSPEGNNENEGTAWETAFLTVDFALCKVLESDEIWVAQGLYRPKLDEDCLSGSSQEDATYYINKSVSIYGGFEIGASSIEEQNPQKFMTILSGGESDLSDNSRHVITIEGAQKVIIDGFTIRDGFASGTSGRGGGIEALSSTVEMSLNISKCYFTNNKSTNNGGALFLGSTSSGMMCAVVDGCIFNDNETSASGGAIATRSTAKNVKLNVVNTIFSDNFADASAGVVSAGSNNSGEGFLDFIHCTFVNNRADLFGGVMRTVPASSGGPISVRLFQCVTAWNFSPNGPFQGSGSVSYEFYNCSIQEENSCAGLGSPSTFTCSGDMLFGLDPQFVDTLNNDFRLRASSPMINRGEVIPYENCAGDEIDVVNDISGDKRNEPYDYGAYEYVCIDNLSLGGELSSGTYFVSNEITSNGIVTDSTVLDAGQSIELDLNFEVEDDAVFEAQIGGCN